MMRVAITGFGSVWRRRVEESLSDPRRFQKVAYFNTTGVMVNGKIVRHRKIAGHVRFNGAGGFNPNYPQRMIGKVFECDEPWCATDRTRCSSATWCAQWQTRTATW